MQTHDTAELYGLGDRGTLEVGQEGRPQRHRSRPPRPRTAPRRARPPRRRHPPPAGRRGLRGHDRERCRDPPRRPRHRRPPRPARPGRPPGVTPLTPLRSPGPASGPSGGVRVEIPQVAVPPCRCRGFRRRDAALASRTVVGRPLWAVALAVVVFGTLLATGIGGPHTTLVVDDVGTALAAAARHRRVLVGVAPRHRSRRVGAARRRLPGLDRGRGALGLLRARASTATAPFPSARGRARTSRRSRSRWRRCGGSPAGSGRRPPPASAPSSTG